MGGQQPATVPAASSEIPVEHLYLRPAVTIHVKTMLHVNLEQADSHPSIVRASVSTQEPSVMNRKTSAVIYPVRTVETAPTITQETHLFVPAQQGMVGRTVVRTLMTVVPTRVRIVECV